MKCNYEEQLFNGRVQMFYAQWPWFRLKSVIVWPSFQITILLRRVFRTYTLKEHKAKVELNFYICSALSE